MKKTIISLLLSLSVTFSASAFDIRDIFGGAGAGDILSGIQSTIENATAEKSFTIDELKGTWKYSSPGVQFDSQNSLEKLGGAAAGATIENKLAPYYRKAGITSMVLTVDNAHNFTIKIKNITLKGTIAKGTNNKLIFNFQAFGKMNLGKVNCMATKSGNMLNLCFDVRRMVEILNKVSSVVKNSSYASLVNLLSKYDGIYVGAKMRR